MSETFILQLIETTLSVNFERLDDAVRARKALNGRDVLGSDVGAIRIGFAKVPVKGGQDSNGQDENPNIAVQGIGDLSVGATIHALRSVKGASTIPADQQVLGGAVENYRSNLLLSMISAGTHTTAHISDGIAKPAGWAPSVTEQQMIMRELSVGSADADTDVHALSGSVSKYFFLPLQRLITIQPILQSSVPLRCTTLQYLKSQRDLTIDAGMPPNYAS